MKTRLKLLWYWLETKWVKALRLLFGIKLGSDVIPNGMYCYEYDEEKNKRAPLDKMEYWVKVCPYYRSTPETKGIACTYSEFFGADMCLYDQCKICGEKEDM